MSSSINQTLIWDQKMTMKSVLGTFSKGNETARSINFSESGGENCSGRCPHKGNSCYAERVEKLYPSAKKSGIAKRKMGAVQILNRATMEIRTLRNVWLRVSVLGSLPKISQAKREKGFAVAFENFLKAVKESGSKIHIPVEDYEKASFYTELAGNWAVIRESCFSKKRVLETPNKASHVIGEKGTPMQTRIDQCHDFARTIRKTGKTAIVCAAVKPRNYTGRPVKCGDCTACSSEKVDVVLYPLH